MSHTNFKWDQLQEWSKRDLIEQVLLLQNHINNYDYERYSPLRIK